MQTPIRVFSSTLDFIAEIDNYFSLTFQRKLYGAGIFVLKIASQAKYASELLTKNRIITLENDSKRAGIIKSIQYIKSGNSENYVIRGYELKGILAQRITIPASGDAHIAFNNKSGEYILKGLVQQNQDTTGKEFDILTIATNTDKGTSATTRSRYKNLLEEVARIGKVTGVGSQISIDYTEKELVFDVIEIVDKTSGTANPVIFSTKYDNILRQDYLDSDMNASNNALVGGQGTGASRTIVETSTTLTDFELSDTFVDARDIDDTDDLTSRGLERLASMQSEFFFDCEILDNKPFRYRIDWDLGTKVTVTSERLNVSLDKVIEEITEYYDNGFRIEVVFGNPAKNVRENIYIATDYGIE